MADIANSTLDPQLVEVLSGLQQSFTTFQQNFTALQQTVTNLQALVDQKADKADFYTSKKSTLEELNSTAGTKVFATNWDTFPQFANGGGDVTIFQFGTLHETMQIAFSPNGINDVAVRGNDTPTTDENFPTRWSLWREIQTAEIAI